MFAASRVAAARFRSATRAGRSEQALVLGPAM